MRAEGSNGSVELTADSIIIRRKGLLNKITQGVQGDKVVPLASITALQFKDAGSWMAGMIQFTLLGRRESAGGLMEATKDENAVLFEKKQQPAFDELRQRVQSLIQKPKGVATPVGGAADNLSKLADLVNRGFLTREEFEHRKAAILAA